MLRPIMTLRPAAARVEFDAQKISNFAKYAIFHFAHQLAARITDPEVGLQRDRPLDLQARAGE